MTKDETLRLALEALKLAQDNLRDHGDNCFLHDEGEYNRCFCGKDSLNNHLQSVVEKLEEALAQPEQEPVFLIYDDAGGWIESNESEYRKTEEVNRWLLYTTPPKRPWVGLTAQEAADCWTTSATKTWHNFEAALKEKNT